MNKTAFVFPGQGTQYIGMGKDFYDNYDEAKRVFEMGSEILNKNLCKLCFEENEEIHKTENTQIAVFTVSLAIYKVLQMLEIRANVHAGLSLGEYSALAASEVFSIEELFKLVQKRGEYMYNAYPQKGAMSAVIGLDGGKIKELIKPYEGKVYIANYNCPGEIVISGMKKDIDECSRYLKCKGARFVIPLKVSGPFHSPLLKEASEKLQILLEEYNPSTPAIPIVSNVTAEYMEDKNCIKNLMCDQIIFPVKWQQSIEKLRNDGVECFIEVGPKKTLTNFIRTIDSRAKTVNIEKIEDIDKYKQMCCRR